jgi:hypothetical protein
MKCAAIALVLSACMHEDASQLEQAATGSGSGSACPMAPITATCAPAEFTGVYQIIDTVNSRGDHNCQYTPQCRVSGIWEIPIAADDQCTAAVEQACNLGVSWGYTFSDQSWGSAPCDPISADTLSLLRNHCRGTPPVTVQCQACTQTHSGLCPDEQPGIIEWRSGCGTPTTSAGPGYTRLAEFGAPDGGSADFQCQWVQSCNVSAPDLGSPILDEGTDTITTCFPADGGNSTLCDPAQFASASQPRSVLFTRHWQQGMRVYYNDGLYRVVTRDDVRVQAKADCDAASLPATASQTMCTNALAQLVATNSQLSMRMYYCCTSEASPVPTAN